MEKMIISRTIDSAGFFELTLTPRLTFLPPVLKSGYHSQKQNVGHLTDLPVDEKNITTLVIPI